MKVLFFQWHSFLNEGMERALQKLIFHMRRMRTSLRIGKTTMYFWNNYRIK